MSFTAAEIESAISQHEEELADRDEGVYEELHYGENVEVGALGTLEYVDSYGGEGQGDDYWVVFKLGEQFFRKDGWYASYDGGDLDGDLYEVKAVEVTRTEYEKI